MPNHPLGRSRAHAPVSPSMPAANQKLLLASALTQGAQRCKLLRIETPLSQVGARPSVHQDVLESGDRWSINIGVTAQQLSPISPLFLHLEPHGLRAGATRQAAFNPFGFKERSQGTLYSVSQCATAGLQLPRHQHSCWEMRTTSAQALPPLTPSAWTGSRCKAVDEPNPAPGGRF